MKNPKKAGLFLNAFITLFEITEEKRLTISCPISCPELTTQKEKHKLED